MFLLSNRDPLIELPVRRFEADLRAGLETSCLLTPTATMAEHIRHSLARRGFFVRPDSIVTLSRFVEPLVRDVPQAGPAALDRIVARLLLDNPPAAFRLLARSNGLRRVLAGSIEELSTAGCDSALLKESVHSATGLALAELYAIVEQELTARGLLLRSARLRQAAERLPEQRPAWQRVYLTGFYAFTPAELEILAAFEPAEVMLSLPDWEGTVESRRALARHGFRESHIEDEPSRSVRSLFHAVSEQQEAEEIARRILALQSRGRSFREIGVIVRREQPYAALLRSTFRRFGIPARFYFPRTLAAHPVWRYFNGFLDALDAAWDYERLMPVLRMHYAGLAALVDADELDHKLRQRCPAYGFPEELAEPLAAWRGFEPWRTALHAPAEWTAELDGLRAILQMPLWKDEVPHEQALLWRELLSALDGWREALEQTAALLPADPISLAEFRLHLTHIAEHVAISDRDQRSNVVHVLDVYEARQWSLPVVFVCGMLERTFPQYHNEHPVLPDEDRERLRQRGVVLRTSGERQREERVLFETAIRCATAQLTLSYSRTNSKGEETLPSFFLSDGLSAEAARMARPQPKWSKTLAAASSIRDPQLLTALKKARASLSPTAIETYLQCPWQFFARHILKLRPAPPQPHERLDFLLQGSILHETLAETEGSPLFVEEIFSRLFDDACRNHSLPQSCRTERVRLELHANLRRFLESAPLKNVTTLAVEDSFSERLSSDLRIRGKMDRVAQLPDRGLVIIDYKYSTKERVRGRVRSHDRGELVQGGLYLWAAERVYKQPAAGMLYCGLRGEVAWAGWHLPSFGWADIGESTDAAGLRDIINDAVEISQRVALRISLGDVAPSPADVKKCDWCDFSDTCRVETATPPLVQIAGGGA